MSGCCAAVWSIGPHNDVISTSTRREFHGIHTTAINPDPRHVGWTGGPALSLAPPAPLAALHGRAGRPAPEGERGGPVDTSPLTSRLTRQHREPTMPTLDSESTLPSSHTPSPKTFGAPPSPELGQARLGVAWRHSSYSQGTDQTCVDVALGSAGVAVRDSKDPTGPILNFSLREWHVFLLGARSGEFDLPGSPQAPGA